MLGAHRIRSHHSPSTAHRQLQAGRVNTVSQTVQGKVRQPRIKRAIREQAVVTRGAETRRTEAHSTIRKHYDL